MQEYKSIRKSREALFALGHIGPGMLNYFIILWALKFFKDSALLSGVMVGWAITSGKLMDALVEPFVANFSDNLRNSRWGRRLPFMIFGTLPLAISFIMIWNMPAFTSKVAIFIWFFIFVNLFYFFYNMVVNPYFSLLPEMFSGEGDRARVQGYVALFGALGMGITMGGSGFLIQFLGHGITSICLAALCVLVMLAPILTVKVNPDFSFNEKTPRDNTFKNLFETIRNPLFIKYILGFGLFFLGFSMVQSGLAFIAAGLLGLKEGSTSLMTVSSVVVALALIPFYQHIIKKKGSFFALKMAILSYAAVSLLIPLLGQFPFSPLVNGLIFMALLGFSYSGLMVIPNVLLSRIIDDDTQRYGKNREAMFFGSQGLVNNSVQALAGLLLGYLLDYFGGTQEQALGILILGPLVSVLALLGFFFIRKEK